jgi:hypothetical protein
MTDKSVFYYLQKKLFSFLHKTRTASLAQRSPHYKRHSKTLSLRSSGHSSSDYIDKWQTRPLVREGAPKWQDSDFKKKEKISGQKSQIGLDTKINWLTDCQL